MLLKNFHRQRFKILQVTSLELQRRSSARIVAHALTHAMEPHLNGVYICGRDLHARSLLHASDRDRGVLIFFFFLLNFLIFTLFFTFFFDRLYSYYKECKHPL